jgi:hypothetical protein
MVEPTSPPPYTVNSVFRHRVRGDVRTPPPMNLVPFEGYRTGTNEYGLVIIQIYPANFDNLNPKLL